MNLIELKINEIVNSLFTSVLAWFGYTCPISVSISLGVILIGIIIITTVLASAFWSAQLAEENRKKRLIHFWGGLFIPWLYPFFIYKSIICFDKHTANTKTAEPTEKITESETKAKFFAKLATDENGTPQGPFIFYLTDNSTIKVKLITEVKDNLIIVDAVTPAGKSQKLRIPYSQIKSYSKK
jgi:hypothetical protein